MAKSNPGAQLLSVGGAALVLFFVWQYLRGGSSLVGNYPTNQASAASNPLSSLAQSLKSLLSGGKGSGGASKPSGGSGGQSPSGPNYSAGAGGFNVGQNFVNWANASNQAWQQSASGVLGSGWDAINAGTDFVNPANYDTSMQTLDVSQFAKDFNPFDSVNTGADYSGAYTDFFAGGGGFDPSIGYEDTGLGMVDVGSFDLYA